MDKNALWLDLLNSDWHDHKGGGGHEDRIYNSHWLKGFLSSWRKSLGSVPEAEIQQRLMELRGLLRRMADDFSAKKRIKKSDLDALNEILGNSPLIRKIVQGKGEYSIHSEDAKPGMDSMLSQIALSFADTLAHGDPERIKICKNPDCLWIFYDNSKNHSRRWCENATGCGNMMKVRRFRAKQKSIAKLES